MKIILLLITVMGCVMLACSLFEPNPFLEEWNTPFGTAPFDRIKNSHFKPALIKGMEIQKEEIQSIIANTETPNFKNTIEALEFSGEVLDKTNKVFGAMKGAKTNDELQKISKEMAPLLSKHSDDIRLNEDLFKRIKFVWENKEAENLTPEQTKVLEEYYKDFVRNGANLPEDKKQILREINEELSLLSLQFGENVLKEVNGFEMVLEDETDLAGLTDAVLQAAAETAKEKGYEGKWVFTIQKPSLIPFLQYSDNRELREKMFKAYIMQGDHGDELDNKSILSKMVALRVQRSKLLGYETHADFVLEKNMAGEPANVYALLNQLWKPALKRAKKEAKALQKMIDQEGGGFKLEPWDWWYYAEKLKVAKYDLDESMLRPYFQLEKVRQGAFDVANKLWGLSFEKQDNIQVYHKDVEVFEVKDIDGSHIGILYTDFFPRASKRGGAWMDNFRTQVIKDGVDIRPIIYNVGNFSKPVGDTPALLSLEEVTTLYHEFGHALHGLLSECTYPKLSGTNVPWDFVELPSQIMENWALEPSVLKSYAQHYETGEPIPDALIAKIEKSGKFNQGFATVEYLAASFLDMDWHTLTNLTELNATDFEDASMAKIGMIPEIVVRYRSPYFRHIFAGGYSSGYYVYIWAEVLDADAFEAFKENGIFDQKTATAFRENILSRGGTDDPMKLYRQFRGRDASIEPILERRGLK
ncbi:M3 family metallopeptidase [candidate division KSB1 bacterium]|nr:M3 family metallopeptidase [candidate division KSB1 bacterium]